MENKKNNILTICAIFSLLLVISLNIFLSKNHISFSTDMIFHTNVNPLNSIQKTLESKWDDFIYEFRTHIHLD